MTANALQDVIDVQAAIVDQVREEERKRCAGVLRELAQINATHAAVAGALVRVTASTAEVEDLMRQGQRYKELAARATAFADAARAVEEAPGE